MYAVCRVGGGVIRKCRVRCPSALDKLGYYNMIICARNGEMDSVAISTAGVWQTNPTSREIRLVYRLWRNRVRLRYSSR